MNGIIYMRTSPSGRRYIGQTTKPEEVRWKEHVYVAYSKKRNERNLPLSCSIRKYGADSFTVEILESNIQTQSELNKREEYWIKKYHTYIKENKGGLNVSIGGLGHRLYTSEDFQGLYDAGYSLAQISNMTGAGRQTIPLHIETSKHENSSRGRRVALTKDPPRPISCYKINTCEFVKSYSSAAEAIKELSSSDNRSPGLYNHLKGKNARSAYGYLWKYNDEPMDVIYERRKAYYISKSGNKKGKPVVNIQTNEIFSSANSAGKKYNVDSRLIQACCEGKRENAGGFHWKYKNQPYIPYIPNKNKRCKPVICIETGIIFPSTKQAAAETGIYLNYLRDCLKKRTETAGNLHWKYHDE